MADWTFSQVLSPIKSPPSIPTSVLESSDGLCLGDIQFAEICITLTMCLVSIVLLERLIANGSFNLECMAESDYSHTTTILLAFVSDAKLKDIERVGIRLVFYQCRGPLAPISSMDQFITYICNRLKLERASSNLKLGCMSCSSAIMVGIWPLPLTWYSVWRIFGIHGEKGPGCKDVPESGQPSGHVHGNDMVICQLLAQDCSECEYERTSHGGCLLIPRGVHFGQKLFPEIVILRNHATPYSDPTTFYDCGAFQQHEPTVPRHCWRLATVYQSGGDVS